MYNNSPVSAGNITGDGTDTLTITDVQGANAGTSRCDVSNPYGTTHSSNIVLVVTAPPAVSIAYLRSLVDPVSFVPTNTTLLYTATGVITTFTNLTSGNTASYYLQDGTGGINIFATFGSTWRPALGDEVSFVGFLSSFQGVLELEADLQNNLATSATVLSNNIAGLPTPKIISWDSLATNNNANLEYNVEGSLVMLTNVYFGTNAGTIISTSANAYIYVTNGSGQSCYVAFSPQDLDTAGQTLPSFAYAVVGPLNQATNIHQGYQVAVTRWADIVTVSPASPVTIGNIVNNLNGTVTINYGGGGGTQFILVKAATDCCNGINLTRDAWTPVLTNNSTPGSFTAPAVGNGEFFSIMSK
jgi:hypothetical protein